MSVYFPYLRGKQYELVMLRETAQLLAEARFSPIVEPVKESLRGLDRSLRELLDNDVRCIVVVNPTIGDHALDSAVIEQMIHQEYGQHDQIQVGIALTEDTEVDRVLGIIEAFRHKNVYMIHAGFTAARDLAEAIDDYQHVVGHVFFEEACGRLYRRHFRAGHRALLRDGFQRRINREHPEVEFFSDLHVTYQEEGVDAFGDFLIVGNQYSAMGGPAYAIAIHLTFIDPNRDGEMYIHHFVSDRRDTPTDPAGKFAEALRKLIGEIDRPNSPVERTSAVQEFVDLYARGHFPGLGYVKKLAMQHHIETLASYFADE